MHAPDVAGARATQLFTEPGAAIGTLTAELETVWDRYRSADWGQRRSGVLELGSHAHAQ